LYLRNVSAKCYTESTCIDFDGVVECLRSVEKLFGPLATPMSGMRPFAGRAHPKPLKLIREQSMCLKLGELRSKCR
jgi:hypothetical protein